MKIVRTIVCAGLMTMPLLAIAGNLNITNNAKYDLSFKINNVCSEGFGVIPVNTTKVIPEKTFNQECQNNPAHCMTAVYNKADCKGEKIAEVGFDTGYGVSYISSLDQISITGSGFNLIFTSPIKK